MPELSVEDRVANGVGWLDHNVPDWRSKIVVNEFDIFSGCHCVLGQVFRDKDLEQHSGYEYAIYQTKLLSPKEAIEYGFDADPSVYQNKSAYEQFEELQDKWLKVLGEDNA